MNRKQRLSTQQRQENISRKQFEEFLEQHEWVTADVSPDLGEDILVRIYKDGVSTGLSFYVQLKSVSDIKNYSLKTGGISYPFEVKDLEHWEAQAVAIILVVWDIQQKRGWWLWINQAIEFLSKNNPNWRQKDKVNVRIPIKNEFCEDGLLRLRQFLADLYYPIVSKGKELTIQARFSFPKTPDGKAKFSELQKHFAAGDEVELSGKYIDAFTFPDWWTRLYGEVDPSAMHLKIGPAKLKTFRPAQIEFLSPIGEERIPYVELWNVKQGKDEITLSNEKQNISIKFIVVIDKVTRQNKITIKAKYSNLDSVSMLQVLRMLQIMSVEGVIRLTILDTGDVITIPVPSGSFSAPEKKVVDFVEKICLIQESMGIKLKFPEEGSFNKDDLQAADELVSIIQKGHYQQSNMVFTLDLRKPEITKLLEEYKEGSPIYFQISVDKSYVEIFSEQINLGPMTQKIKGNWEMPLEEIRAWYEQAKDEDSLVLRLVSVEMYEEFEKWQRT